MSKKRWIPTALGLLVLLVVLWIAASLFLSPAYAQALPFNMAVRSRLLSDYHPDDGQSLYAALRLSILGDSLRDQGLPSEEAEKAREALENALDDPVPTATALDFEGNDPHTPTPTITLTPTHTATVTPSPTATNTARPTATKTQTPKPTSVAATKTVGPVDNQDPCINNLVLSPSPGSTLTVCSFQVVSMNVCDPAFSAGLSPSDVTTKHSRPSSSDYYYQPVPFVSGGFVSGPGSAWNADYAGPMTVKGVFAGQSFDVYGRVKDLAGNGWIYSSAMNYTLAAGLDCP